MFFRKNSLDGGSSNSSPISSPVRRSPSISSPFGSPSPSSPTSPNRSSEAESPTSPNVSAASKNEQNTPVSGHTTEITEDVLRKLLKGKDPKNVRHPVNLVLSGSEFSFETIDPIFGIIPPKALSSLDIANNRVSSLIIENKDCLLKYINASNNHIATLKLALPHLLELDLGHNNITEVIDLRLPELLSLSLRQNKLTHISSALMGLPKLKRLDISGNGARWSNSEFTQFVQVVARLKNLTELYIEGNDFFELEISYRIIFARFCPKIKTIDGRTITQEERRDAKDFLAQSSILSTAELYQTISVAGSEHSRRPSVSESTKSGFSFLGRKASIGTFAPSYADSAGEALAEEKIEILQFQSLFAIFDEIVMMGQTQEIIIQKICEFEGILVKYPVDVEMQYPSFDEVSQKIKIMYDRLFKYHDEYADDRVLRCIIRFSGLLHNRSILPNTIIDEFHARFLLYDPSFKKCIEEVIPHSLLNTEVTTDGKNKLFRFLHHFSWDGSTASSLKPIATKVWNDLSDSTLGYPPAFFSLVIGERDTVDQIGLQALLDKLIELNSLKTFASEDQRSYILLALAYGCQHYTEFYERCRMEITVSSVINQLSQYITSPLPQEEGESKLQLISLIELAVGLIGGVKNSVYGISVRVDAEITSDDYSKLNIFLGKGIGSFMNDTLSVHFLRLFKCLLIHCSRKHRADDILMNFSTVITSIKDPRTIAIRNRASSLFYSSLIPILVFVHENKDEFTKKFSQSGSMDNFPKDILGILSSLLLVGDRYFQSCVLENILGLLQKNPGLATPEAMDRVISVYRSFDSFSKSDIILVHALKILLVSATQAPKAIEHRTDLIAATYKLFEWNWLNQKRLQNAAATRDLCIRLINAVCISSPASVAATPMPEIMAMAQKILSTEEKDDSSSFPSFIEATSPIGLNVEILIKALDSAEPTGSLMWRVVRQLALCIDDRLPADVYFDDCDSISVNISLMSNQDGQESKRRERQARLHESGISSKLIERILIGGNRTKARNLMDIVSQNTEEIARVRKKEEDDKNPLLALDKNHGAPVYVDEQLELSIAERTARQKLMRCFDNDDEKEEKLEDLADVSKRKTMAGYKSIHVTNSSNRERLLSECLSYLLRLLWYSSDAQKKEIRTRLRTELSTIEGLVGETLNCDFMLNNLGAMLFALLEEVLHYEYSVEECNVIVNMMDVAMQASERITKKFHSQLGENESLTPQQHLLLVHLSALGRSVSKQLALISYNGDSPYLNKYFREKVFERLFPVSNMNRLIQLLYYDQKCAESSARSKAKSLIVHSNIVEVLGEHLIVYDYLEYEILEYINRLEVQKRTTLRPSSLNGLLSSQRDLRYYYGLIKYLAQNERQDFDSKEKLILQTRASMYYPEEKPFIVVIGKNKLYFLRKSMQPPCPGCPPEEFCPAGPALIYKIAYGEITSLSICYDKRRVIVCGGRQTFVFACPTKESSYQILMLIRQAVLEARGADLEIHQDSHFQEQLHNLFHTKEERLILCSALTKINLRGKHQNRVVIVSNKMIYNFQENSEKLTSNLRILITKLLKLRTFHELTEVTDLTHEDMVDKNRFVLIVHFGVKHSYQLSFDSEIDRDTWDEQLRRICPAVSHNTAQPTS